MTTKLYLPASGAAPLASLAINTNWELSTGLVRRPFKIAKSNTALATDTRTWAASSTQQWCWLQFQSPKLKAAYSWTAADTVSMVIGKCAETTTSGDTHLAYVVRVVSADGSTIRGVIGLMHATSTEYPLVASAATRIHSALTTGATVFSSQIGDRIIVEIGLHGVTPALEAIQMRFGDPTATADFALTAGLTTDLDPWVQLSRTVEFGQVVAVGQISETDTVNPILWSPKKRLANRNAETETSQIATRVKKKSIGQKSETDSVFSITVSRPKNISVNQASETESNISLGRQKSKLLGQKSETELAQAVAKIKNLLAGQAPETELAQTITRIKNKVIGQVGETDSTQAITKSKTKAIGQTSETEVSQAFAKQKIWHIVQVGETDLAQQIFGNIPVFVAVGQVQETDLAQQIFGNIPVFVAVSQAQEVDAAQGITLLRGMPVSPKMLYCIQKRERE